MVGTWIVSPDLRAQPQPYPSKSIRFIVPFSPGGGADLTARAIGISLNEAWGQTVVVDNRAGANGNIGLDTAAKSPPDGYTLALVTASHAVNVSLYKKLPYDLVRDLSPVTQATMQPYALVVHPGVPAKSVQELVALLKVKPGMTYGSSGAGGLNHLSGALFASLTGTALVHVPYKGGALAMNEVVGGQIQMLFSTLLQADAHIRSGRLRALAVTTRQRSAAAPELPTMHEAGVTGYEVAGWYGVVVPGRTPRAIVDKLNAEIVRILHTPDIHRRLRADGSEPASTSPDQFGALIKSEIGKWSKVVREAGIKEE